MEYSTIVDGEKFIFKEELFEKELKNLLLRYKYLSNNCFMSIIILDNKEVREYGK